MIFMSSSRMKSPYVFSVTRKVLPEFGTLVPTMAPSATVYSAVPASFFQPLSVLPSKRGVQDWARREEARMRPASVRMECFFIGGIVTVIKIREGGNIGRAKNKKAPSFDEAFVMNMASTYSPALW